MICLTLTIPFAGNKMHKLFLVRVRYSHCCVSVIMRLSGYFTSPHLVSEQFEFETSDLESASRFFSKMLNWHYAIALLSGIFVFVPFMRSGGQTHALAPSIYCNWKSLFIFSQSSCAKRVVVLENACRSILIIRFQAQFMSENQVDRLLFLVRLSKTVKNDSVPKFTNARRKCDNI